MTSDIICDSNISKVIIQFSRNGPKNHTINMIKEKCPGWKYRCFNDEDIINFLKKNPIDEFNNYLKIYNSFLENKHKIDFFKYYYLYLYGGIYLDINVVLEKPIEYIIKNCNFISIKSSNNKNKMIFNGFIGCTHHHPIIYHALNNLYNNNIVHLRRNRNKIYETLFLIIGKSKYENIQLLEDMKNYDKYRNQINTYDGFGNHVITYYTY